MKATKEQRDMFAIQFRFFEKWNGEIHSIEDVKKCVAEGTKLAEDSLYDPLLTQLLASVYIALEEQYKSERKEEVNGDGVLA